MGREPIKDWKLFLLKGNMKTSGWKSNCILKDVGWKLYQMDEVFKQFQNIYITF